MKEFIRNISQMEIITDEKVELIWASAINILWEAGIRFDSEKALKIFERNGCKVDWENNIVQIPPGLVEESLRKCPSSFNLGSRNPRRNVRIGGNRVNFMSYPGKFSVDLNSWETKIASRKEYYEAVTVLDALDSLQTICAYSPWFEMEGVPSAMAMPESYAARLRNSSKVAMVGSLLESEQFHLEMAKVAETDVFLISNATSPLAFYGNAIDTIFRLEESEDIILVVSNACHLGATAPVTVSGGVVTSCAEIMAGIVLAQLVKPGARIMASPGAMPMDMHSGQLRFGDVLTALHGQICDQVWKKAEIPTLLISASRCNAKKIDFQMGYERFFLALTFALSGTGIICLHGGLHGEVTHHPVQAILDDDIANIVGRYIEGVDINKKSMALETIKKVGSAPGHYMAEQHTRESWQEEVLFLETTQLLTYDKWLEKGKKDCIYYARERMEEIINKHKVSPPLTTNQEEEIERILRKARGFYREKSLISDADWETYKRTLESPNYPYA